MFFNLSITIQNNVTRVTVNKEVRQVTVIPNVTNVTVSRVGSQGLPGEGVPAGGTERQVLAKIDATDYNTEWRSNWYDYTMNVEYTGVEATIAAGIVYTCSVDGGTVYRFVNSTNNVNGYPVEDSFYNDFDGTNLTNLIATRG